MQLFLIGPSGSGKDTQATLIAKEYNLRKLSVGEMLRNRAGRTDAFAELINSYINQGQLLDWEYLKQLIEDELSVNSQNYIWTGFPRLIQQAEFFDQITESIPYKLDLVINLKLNQADSIKRIVSRRTSGQEYRIDDINDENIKKRMAWYEESIDEIHSYYEKTNRIVDIDSSKSIEEVFKSIKEVIDQRFGIMKP